MLELFRDFFSKRDIAVRVIRGTAVGLMGMAATTEGQATLAGLAGPYGPLVVLGLGLLGGAIAVGEKNK